MPMQLLIVEDDAMSRELLCLLCADAGFEVSSAESGDAALAMLAEGAAPGAILTDLQMPGTSGTDLAVELRKLCPPGTRIIAMSASGDGADGFDGFLRKPFAVEALVAMLAGRDESATALNSTILANFTASMGKTQRQALYAMCLDDVEKRVVRMRKAVSTGDNATFVKEAHALKGGCGIVGATELHGLASVMEQSGVGTDSDTASAALDRFLVACDRLRRILDAHDR